MNMYTVGSELRISAEGIPEFKALLEKARKEAEQLNNTIAQLSRFELSISFSAESKNQAGDMEAASSTINAMPTK